MLIVLMTSSHCVGLSGVGPDNFFNSRLWLPRGWATDGFVVLSGLTIALLWNSNRPYSELKPYFHRKALQLISVMFASNAIMLAAQHLVQRDVKPLLHLNWWVGLITLSTPYSISGVLLPIAVSLLMVPYCARLGERIGWSSLTIVTIGLNIGFRSIEHIGTVGHAIAPLIAFGAGFPVLPMVAEGAVGFSAGMAWRSLLSDEAEFRQIRAASFVAILLFPYMPMSFLEHAESSLLPVARVLLLMVLSLAIVYVPIFSNAFGFISLLGRFSLFCFVTHRILIQSILLVGRRLQLRPAVLYGDCFVLTLTMLVALCALRLRHQGFNDCCRSCWF